LSARAAEAQRRSAPGWLKRRTVLAAQARVPPAALAHDDLDGRVLLGEDRQVLGDEGAGAATR